MHLYLTGLIRPLVGLLVRNANVWWSNQRIQPLSLTLKRSIDASVMLSHLVLASSGKSSILCVSIVPKIRRIWSSDGNIMFNMWKRAWNLLLMTYKTKENYLLSFARVAFNPCKYLSISGTLSMEPATWTRDIGHADFVVEWVNNSLHDLGSRQDFLGQIIKLTPSQMIIRGESQQ